MHNIETPALHLIGLPKEPLLGTSFEDDDSLLNAAKQWLKRADPDFYDADIQAIVQRWRKVVERDVDYEEK